MLLLKTWGSHIIKIEYINYKNKQG